MQGRSFQRVSLGRCFLCLSCTLNYYCIFLNSVLLMSFDTDFIWCCCYVHFFFVLYLTDHDSGFFVLRVLTLRCLFVSCAFFCCFLYIFARCCRILLTCTFNTLPTNPLRSPVTKIKLQRAAANIAIQLKKWFINTKYVMQHSVCTVTLSYQKPDCMTVKNFSLGNFTFNWP